MGGSYEEGNKPSGYIKCEEFLNCIWNYQLLNKDSDTLSYLTFAGLCVIIYFYTKTNRMHNISNLFYSGPTLHVSDGLSVHHQESKTVHTASGTC
jgi:hypothetical protein